MSRTSKILAQNQVLGCKTGTWKKINADVHYGRVLPMSDYMHCLCVVQYISASAK